METPGVPTISVPKAQAAKIRAALVERLGLDASQIPDGSLVMHWDSDGAIVEWRGVATLTKDEAAELFATTLG